MKLFVGNLSFETTQEELSAIFEPYGPIVELVRPNDRETGRPRGFAFVTMADPEKGRAAVQALDGFSLGGRKLSVNEAEDRGHTSYPPQGYQPYNDQGEKRVDDRPVDKKGKKVTYKSI